MSIYFFPLKSAELLRTPLLWLFIAELKLKPGLGYWGPLWLIMQGLEGQVLLSSQQALREVLEYGRNQECHGQNFLHGKCSHPSGLTLLLGYWHQASSGANNPVLGKRDSPIAVVMHGSRAPCSSHLLFCFALPVICCFMPC